MKMMKNIGILGFGIILISIVFSGCNFMNNKKVKAADDKELNSYTSNLPFQMDKIEVSKFPDKNFNINSYGAKSGDTAKNTTAVKKAIDACSSAGGGKVVVPKGNWITGPIELKSNVNLYLEKGASITFSKNHDDYPVVKANGSSSYSVKCPISGYKLKNVAITGEGTIDGAGDTWRPVKKEKVNSSMWQNLKNSGGVVNSSDSIWWPSKQAMDGDNFMKNHSEKSLTESDVQKYKDYFRPYLLNLKDCKSVLIDGPIFENSPKFGMYINNTNDLVIRNSKVFNEYYAQNGDGIDISSCKNVVMYNDTISAGDDDICMKSSGSSKKNSETPGLENVVIENCTVNKGHGGFVVGSNTDGGMKNIYVHNCNFNGTDAGLRFKSNTTIGGLVQDIYVDGIKMNNIATDAITFDPNYYDNSTSNSKKQGNKIPEFKDIHISNITCNGANKAAEITGLPNSPIENLNLKNVNIKSKYGFLANYASGLSLDKVDINSTELPAFSIENSSNVKKLN